MRRGPGRVGVGHRRPANSPRRQRTRHHLLGFPGQQHLEHGHLEAAGQREQCNVDQPWLTAGIISGAVMIAGIVIFVVGSEPTDNAASPLALLSPRSALPMDSGNESRAAQPAVVGRRGHNGDRATVTSKTTGRQAACLYLS
jgi:hypothetical protein